MNIKEHVPTLINFIDKTQQNPLLEFETVFKNIDKNIFDNVIKKIKGIPNIISNSSSETLDIFIENENYRYTIKGKESITKYCKTNNIEEIDQRKYDILEKKNINKIDIDDYNIRFNLKKEEFKKTDIKDWNKKNKYFRYKKRFSFITPDKLLSFDLFK